MTIIGTAIVLHTDMDHLNPERKLIEEEIRSWKAFSYTLNDEHDKREFEDMVGNYCIYSKIIIDAGWQSIPSKPLVMSLLFYQYRKIMQWLICKTTKN
ncbi:MAG: hypothetical protein M3297_11920 [Thermoproteota archaeon]|nr:hypothetical protein [Thermoproteota archaeon]